MRISIYLQDKLHKRMKEFEEREGLRGRSWSDIAQEAFHDFLVCAESKSGIVVDPESVARRLLASRKKASVTARVQGHRVGHAWAGAEASYDELAKVAFDYGRQPAETPDGVDWIVRFLASAATDEKPTASLGIPLEDEPFKAGEKLIGARNYDKYKNSAEFACGFLEGALDLWDEVSRYL